MPSTKEIVGFGNERERLPGGGIETRDVSQAGYEEGGSNAVSPPRITAGASAVEHFPPARLKPHPKNPKKQIRQIAKSIGRFGFRGVVVINGKHEILAGHGRVPDSDRKVLENFQSRLLKIAAVRKPGRAANDEEGA